MGKRAYRYVVTATGGAGERAVGDSPFIIDWQYLGREYTWNIIGGPQEHFESVGFITGRYVDKGHLDDDGQYVEDSPQGLTG